MIAIVFIAVLSVFGLLLAIRAGNNHESTREFVGGISVMAIVMIGFLSFLD